MSSRMNNAVLHPDTPPKKRGFFRALFKTVIILLIIATVGFFLWRHFVRPPEVLSAALIMPPHMETDLERREGFYTFLIIGLDEGNRTDTIMVGSIDTVGGYGHIVSIPRDTQVDAQRRVRKINVAYPAGNLHGGGHDGGIRQLKNEVQTLIGFKPDFYVSLDMEAATEFIDAIGGVEIYVPFHMHYNDPYQNLFIDLQPGLQTLDGENAIHFARYRMGDSGFRTISDHLRVEHQQQVLRAMLESLTRPANIPRVPSLIRLTSELLLTDLDRQHLLWFGQQIVLPHNSFELETHTLPIRGNTGRSPWYEYPDPAGIIDLVNRTINPFTTDITRDMLRIAR